MAPENPTSEISVERKVYEPQCIICGAVAVTLFPIDPDIQPWGACEAHRTNVPEAFTELMSMGEEAFNEYITSCNKYPRPYGRGICYVLSHLR